MYRMITMHALPRQTARQMDRQHGGTNIMAIVRRFVLISTLFHQEVVADIKQRHTERTYTTDN